MNIVDTQAQHTAEHILKILVTADKCQEKYGCIVKGLVTDNTADMAKMCGSWRKRMIN